MNVKTINKTCALSRDLTPVCGLDPTRRPLSSDVLDTQKIGSMPINQTKHVPVRYKS